MTTNARDEKWSSWIDWSGGECPVDKGADVSVRYRNGEENIGLKAGICLEPGGTIKGCFAVDWNHIGSDFDIIAYRYKIKEPESDMHPDLEKCAQYEWNGNFDRVTWNHSVAGPEWFNSKYFTGKDGYKRSEHSAARQQLGLDQPEVTPEEDEAWQAKEREQSKSDGSTASYYELPPDCTELQDLISYRNLNAQDGEIFRAIYRKGRASHSDALRDARKVLFYAKAEVERLERYCIG